MRIVADEDALTSRVGTAMVAQLADRIGLTKALSDAVTGRTSRRSRVDDDRVLPDLALMLVDGGGAVSDLGVLRDQPALFGEVASISTAARVVEANRHREHQPPQRTLTTPLTKRSVPFLTNPG